MPLARFERHTPVLRQHTPVYGGKALVAPGKTPCAKMGFLVLAPIKIDTPAVRCHLLVVKFHKPVFKFHVHVANTTRLFLITHARCKFHALVLLLCALVVNATRPFLVPHALFWKQFLCDQMTEIKIPCFEGNFPCFRAKFLVVRGKIPCAKMRFLVLAPIKIDTPAVRCHLLVVKFHKPVFKFHVHVANTTRLFLITHARCKFHALVLLLCALVVNATRPFLVPHALFWKQFLCDQMTEIKIPCFEGNFPCFRAKFLVVRGKIPCAKM